jgi:hypothetical protein
MESSYVPVLIVTLAGMLFTTAGLIVRYAYKSKCTRVSCCCLTIERNIPEEVREDMQAVNHGMQAAPSLETMQRQSLDLERR